MGLLPQRDDPTSGSDALGVLARVRALLPQLAPAEQRVAAFFREHPAEAVRLPITDLVGRIGVSDATITRTSQALGYRGLRDLKLALAAETRSPVPPIHEDVLPTDDAPTIAAKVIRAEIETLSDTLAAFDRVAFAAAVAALDAARWVEVYGVGFSAPVATDAYSRLMRLGLAVAVVTDPYWQRISAAKLAPGDVAWGISHTGRTHDTREALRLARAAGARTLLLTSHRAAPAARLADVVLAVASRETAVRTEPIASRVAHLAIVDALVVALGIRRGTAGLEAVDRADALVDERREASHETVRPGRLPEKPGTSG